MYASSIFCNSKNSVQVGMEVRSQLSERTSCLKLNSISLLMLPDLSHLIYLTAGGFMQVLHFWHVMYYFILENFLLTLLIMESFLFYLLLKYLFIMFYHSLGQY